MAQIIFGNWAAFSPVINPKHVYNWMGSKYFMVNGPHFPLFSTPNFVKWNGRKFFRKNGHHFLQISLPKFVQWNGSLFFFWKIGQHFLFSIPKICTIEWAHFSDKRAAFSSLFNSKKDAWWNGRNLIFSQKNGQPFPFSIPAILQSNGRIFAEKRAAFSLFSLKIPEMFTIKPFVLGGLGGIWAAFAPFLNSKTVYSQMGSIYLLEPKFVQSNGLNFSKIGQHFLLFSIPRMCTMEWVFFFFRKDGQDVPCFQSQTFEDWNGQKHFRKKLAALLLRPTTQFCTGHKFLGEKWPAFSPPGLTCFGRSGSFSPVLHPKNVHSQKGSTFPGNGHLPLLAIPQICAIKWAQNNCRKNGQHFPLYLTKNGQHFVLFGIQNCNTHLNPKVPTRKWAAFRLFYTQNSKSQTDGPKFFQKNGQHIALLQNTETKQIEILPWRFFPENASQEFSP